MPTDAPKYAFFSDLARIVNAGQSRSVLVTGDVHDLFFVGEKPSKLDDADKQQGDGLAGEYLPLMPYLCKQCDIPGTVVLVYELNGPIRCVDPGDHKRLREAWITWKTGLSPDHFTLKALTDPDAGKKKQQLEQSFDQHINEATGKPTVALELLRQLTLCAQHARRHALRKSDGFKLIILIEAADLLMPAGDGDITKLGQADRHRIAIMQDWLSDPGFIEGDDTLIMLAESRSAVHGRVSKLPQVLSVAVPSPDKGVRRHYLDWFCSQREKEDKPLPMISDLNPPPWREGQGRVSDHFESQGLDRWIEGSAPSPGSSPDPSLQGGGYPDPHPRSSSCGDPVRAQVAHEIVLDGDVLQRLGGPVRIDYPGVPLTEAAALLGRDYGGMRRWLPVGAGRSRVERDTLGRRGRTYDGRLQWAAFEDPGYALKVRYEPPGRHNRRGREVPVVWSDHPLDPGASKGRPPAWWWGSMWTGLSEKIPSAFEQVVQRVPRLMPYPSQHGEGERALRFRGWLWTCPCCGKAVPKLYAPLPVWTIGQYLGVEEGLAVEGLSGEWLPGVIDRWAGRRRLKCRRCWRVRDGGAADLHGWNEFVAYMSGGLLYGHEVEQPADFQYERRRAYVKRPRKKPKAAPREHVDPPALTGAAGPVSTA
ncbi:MAG: hypothetical protein AAGI37_09700 [Planctomycetota bacterium]